MTEPRAPILPLLAGAKELVIETLNERLNQEGFVGLRSSHGCIFRFVDSDGSRLTVLAERSSLTKQAVGEVADELERLGYVQRVSDPADRRAKLIRLTPLGHRAQASARRIFGEIEAEWEQRFGAERVAGMRELLEAVTGAAPVAAG